MACGCKLIAESFVMKIRISLVHYLNSAPLGWAFLHGSLNDRFEVIPSSPAICADQLSKGEVEIGLIPSIEFQRIPGLSIIPGIAIACTAKVRSILLIKPKGLKTITSVALDTSSRTSVALTRILLAQKFGIRPEFVPHVPDPAAMLKRCDAALVIGDAALKVQLEDYDTLDLSEEWVQWQQKPFVFAFWACRCDAALPGDLNAVFRQAKGIGLAARSQIASAYARSLNLPKPFLEDYLHNNIDFDMGPSHIAGLETYYRLAHQEKLIPELKSLRFLNDSNCQLSMPDLTEPRA
jgi:chorismate dehydratase